MGEEAKELYSVGLGAVRLTRIFGSAGVSPERLSVMRSFAEEAFRDAIPGACRVAAGPIGSSGTISAIVAAHGDARRMTLRSVSRAVEKLAEAVGRRAARTVRAAPRGDHRRGQP